MKLSDLMTAAQALKIIEMLEDITKRIENLENEIYNNNEITEGGLKDVYYIYR